MTLRASGIAPVAPLALVSLVALVPLAGCSAGRAGDAVVERLTAGDAVVERWTSGAAGSCGSTPTARRPRPGTCPASSSP